MKYNVTNSGRGPRGILSTSGRVEIIARGATKVVDVSDAEAASPSADLALVPLQPRGDALAPAATDTRVVEDRSPAGLAALASALLVRKEAESMKFMTFKKEATALLGDATPEKSADIVAALEEMARAGQEGGATGEDEGE